MRRRATTGVDGTREVGFCFFFGGCSSVGGGFFHTLRRDGTPPCGGAGEGVFGLGDSFAVGLGAVAGGEVENCEG